MLANSVLTFEGDVPEHFRYMVAGMILKMPDENRLAICLDELAKHKPLFAEVLKLTNHYD